MGEAPCPEKIEDKARGKKNSRKKQPVKSGIMLTYSWHSGTREGCSGRENSTKSGRMPASRTGGLAPIPHEERDTDLRPVRLDFGLGCSYNSFYHTNPRPIPKRFRPYP